jgi:hypothetical protein
MASSTKGSWPELVGKTGEEAKAAIKKERPELDVHVLPNNSMVTMDFRTDRVRIFVDDHKKVTNAPKCG